MGRGEPGCVHTLVVVRGGPADPAVGQGIVWHHVGNHYDHPRHRHVALELNLIVGGRGHYEVGGRCHPLSAGTVLFIPPGADHYLEERTPDFEMRILALKPALLERACAGGEGAAFLQTVAAGDSPAALRRRCALAGR